MSFTSDQHGMPTFPYTFYYTCDMGPYVILVPWVQLKQHVISLQNVLGKPHA